ncbi:MAG: CHAT domain-containing protein, partial [Nannocystaceae bacterium]
RTLTGRGDAKGDVAASLQATRRTFIERGAEVFSPVLYLRGHSSQLFDFRRRAVIAPAAPRAAIGVGVSDPTLNSLLTGPYSLVLGSRGTGLPGRPELMAGLLKGLKDLGETNAEWEGLDLSSLAQHFFLRRGKGRLNRIFQKVFGTVVDMPVLPFFRSIAKSVQPGAHTTLLWLPMLEQALAEVYPDRTIYVVQPAAPGSGESRLVMARYAGATQWEEEDYPPPDIDLTRDFIILRLYGGYSPEAQPVLTTPKITEDDHIQGLLELRDLFPRDWECQFVGWMRTHPILCVGLSVFEWRHRMLLRWLLDDRPPTRVSVAVIDPESGEHDIWERGAGGLFGRGTIHAVDLNIIALSELIQVVSDD